MKSPVSDMLSQGRRLATPVNPDSTKSSVASNSPVKIKHLELLKVKREIVLPLHMRKLLEACKFIDDSLNFLQHCRHKEGNSKILFSEVKASVEKSFARSISISIFRQILNLVPDFFSHSWERDRATRDPVLAINF